MKVVINAFSARLGGGQTYLKQLLGHLPADAGLDIVLFAPDSLVVAPDPRISRPTVKWPVGNPLLRAVWERLVLPGILRRTRADILFCPGGVVATRAPDGCRTVTMFRNMIPFTPELVHQMRWGSQRLRNIVLKRVMLRSMATADLTIFISEFAKSVILASGPVKKSVTISHGISDAFRTADDIVLRPKTLPEKDYLLYVSRFDIYKHHREVVQAYAALPDAWRNRYPLVLIGECDTPEAEAVRRMTGETELTANVQIMGAVPYAELPAWYHHAKLSLFASSCENCPNILLEALGAGRPVLSSNVMPMPEFGGEDILYFAPDDPTTLTTAMLAVLTDEATEQRVAKAAKAESGRYHWNTTAARTWVALRELGTP